MAFCRAPYCYYWANSSGFSWHKALASRRFAWCQRSKLSIKLSSSPWHQTNLLDTQAWHLSLTSSKSTWVGPLLQLTGIDEIGSEKLGDKLRIVVRGKRHLLCWCLPFTHHHPRKKNAKDNLLLFTLTDNESEPLKKIAPQMLFCLDVGRMIGMCIGFQSRQKW